MPQGVWGDQCIAFEGPSACAPWRLRACLEVLERIRWVARPAPDGSESEHTGKYRHALPWWGRLAPDPDRGTLTGGRGLPRRSRVSALSETDALPKEARLNRRLTSKTKRNLTVQNVTKRC
eukprot:8056304-Pyramimonas_sp.AAC.1